MSTLLKWRPLRDSGELEEWRPLARWTPFREMERMMERMRDMDQWFNGPLALHPGGEESLTIAQWAPSVDVAEDEKEFIIKAELPEVNKEDVKVTVEDGVLTISGERKAEKEEKGKKFHRIERSYGRFERSFTLPRTAEAGKISSGFKDGVLTVHLPKNPSALPKPVEIKVE